MKTRSVLFIFAILISASASGACLGTSPNLTALTWADLAACHTAAKDGDTITVTAGTYTASTATSISKYVKVVMGGTVNLTDNTCTDACTTHMLSISESATGSTKLRQ